MSLMRRNHAQDCEHVVLRVKHAYRYVHPLVSEDCHSTVNDALSDLIWSDESRMTGLIQDALDSFVFAARRLVDLELLRAAACGVWHFGHTQFLGTAP